MRRALVIEDGTEYAEFAHAFLSDTFCFTRAGSGREALLLAATADCFLIDLRFDRASRLDLVGDVTDIAERLFGDDHSRALRHLQDQQGLYILRELRQAGFHQPAMFVHDFTPRRLHHLRALYGEVTAIPHFDIEVMRRGLGG